MMTFLPNKYFFQFPPAFAFQGFLHISPGRGFHAPRQLATYSEKDTPAIFDAITFSKS